MNLAALTGPVMVAALAGVMFSMGLKVKFEEVVAAARELRLVLLGLLANFVLVPVVTALRL